MASGFQASFDDARTVVDERASHVADDFCAGEEFGEIVHRAAHLSDFVVGGFDSGDHAHDLFDFGAITASGDEGDVEFAQEFGYQASGKAIGTIHDHGLLGTHVDPPTRRSRSPRDRSVASGDSSLKSLFW